MKLATKRITSPACGMRALRAHAKSLPCPTKHTSMIIAKWHAGKTRAAAMTAHRVLTSSLISGTGMGLEGPARFCHESAVRMLTNRGETGKTTASLSNATSGQLIDSERLNRSRSPIRYSKLSTLHHPPQLSGLVQIDQSPQKSHCVGVFGSSSTNNLMQPNATLLLAINRIGNCRDEAVDHFRRSSKSTIATPFHVSRPAQCGGLFRRGTIPTSLCMR